MGADTTTLIVKLIKNRRVCYTTLCVQAADNFNEYEWFLYFITFENDLKFTEKYEIAKKIASKYEAEDSSVYGIVDIDYSKELGISYTKNKLQLTNEQWKSMDKYKFG